MDANRFRIVPHSAVFAESDRDVRTGTACTNIHQRSPVPDFTRASTRSVLTATGGEPRSAFVDA